MQRKATLFAALLMLLGLTISPPQACRAADEDPLQDFCVALNANDQQITINGLLCKPAAEVKANDFASQQLRNPGMFSAKLGSAVNLASATTFGALNTQGLSIARIDFKPKGVNPPHVHPRSTEVLFLAQGTLVVGFVSTAPQNRLFFKTIHAGDLFVFPARPSPLPNQSERVQASFRHRRA
ncbi:hypothetical protein KP509_20G090100 [Ceratopteris richardii]|uniref:Germin-like protein n=1 Tax=Ceratopteris richardii TaxID=49495 RepID=A0A8T2SL75_CERRI|nr:hypothetical protein KP509_20G090100 [Ceratopteris richardii]